jgi:hypothetical protein
MMGAGLLMCSAALALRLALETEPAVPRVVLLALGLLSAGIAVAMRLGGAAPPSLDRVLGPSRKLILYGLAVVFFLLALAPIAILGFTFFDLDWFPWKTGHAVYISIVVVPLCFLTARRAILLQLQGRGISGAEESALLLLLAAACCFIACWALYLPDDPQSWDSMRLALATFMAVALIGAPLALASTSVRRWTISIFVLLHFSAIVTATLSAPPSPWVVSQMWMRLYRPYLEFMYLNNAYHFYAPEPGPPNYLWCRLIYQKAGDPDGELKGDWFKVPGIDEKTGRHQHQVALEYQRYLALMANTEPTETVQFISGANQQVAPFFEARRRCADPTPVVGRPTPTMYVPFHPLVPGSQQYARPTDVARRLVSSYVRHIASVKADALPGYELRWVKVYRVRHDIPPPEAYAKLDPPMSANDPTLYRPFYMGRYNIKGELLDVPGFNEHGVLVSGDPFLFWLLPIHSWDNSGVIRDYARLHAGDVKWIRLPDTEQWVTEEEAHRHFNLLQRPAPKDPVEPPKQ